MKLRTRVAIIAALAVAIAMAGASAALYVSTAQTLRGSVDRSLRDLASDLDARTLARQLGFGPRAGRLGGPGGFVQLVTEDGLVLGASRGRTRPLPVVEQATQVAAGEHGSFLHTVRVDDEPVRILTVPGGPGLAVQIARPLGEVEAALATLRRRLLLGGAGGILLAATLGMVVARRALQPVHGLTEVAEEVAATGDLSRRIETGSDDEVGRLARTFNSMLTSLEQARNAQQQLVADASHELRTPLTSLRTNIEVLADADRLDPDDRRRLISDVVGQLDEFGRLVGALVELARGAQPARATSTVQLDEIARSAIEHVAGIADASQEFDLDAEPVTVTGEADRLERAVVNLLDNAVKYGGGDPVEVRVAPGTLSVRDHGPGIDPDHVDQVFDRFFRAPQARGAEGSGLGLAIVKQIAEAHGGTVEATNAPGGGAAFTIRLPHATAPGG